MYVYIRAQIIAKILFGIYCSVDPQIKEYPHGL